MLIRQTILDAYWYAIIQLHQGAEPVFKNVRKKRFEKQGYYSSVNMASFT